MHHTLIQMLCGVTVETMTVLMVVKNSKSSDSSGDRGCVGTSICQCLNLSILDHFLVTENRPCHSSSHLVAAQNIKSRSIVLFWGKCVIHNELRPCQPLLLKKEYGSDGGK